jgi:hypothetical protein
VKAVWKMRAGPSVSAIMEQASNHLKWLRLRGVVMSVEVKAAGYHPEQVSVRETSASKPSDNAS